MKSVIGVVIVMLSFQSLAVAQDARESWENLRRLRAGQKIEVTLLNAVGVSGRFVDVSPDLLVVQVKDRAVNVPRARIRKVTDQSKSPRNTMVGMAVGAGIGTLIGFAGDCSRRTERCSGLTALLIGLPVGAAAGATAGALIDPVVYRAPSGPTAQVP